MFGVSVELLSQALQLYKTSQRWSLELISQVQKIQYA